MIALSSASRFFTVRILLLATLFITLPTAARAQTEGSISGTITDTSGGAVPGTTVTVTNLETGAMRRLVTGDDGRYDAPLLAVGQYAVTAELSGFQPSKKRVTLVVGSRAAVDFILKVQELAEAVEVQETLGAVSATTADISGLVGERDVKELPLNGRSFDNLLTLNTGIVNVTAGRSGGTGTSASAVGSMFSVSGHRPQENLYLLNGVEYSGSSNINTTPGGASGQLLGVDAIREFELVKDTYGAEYGKRAGAQVNIVTTSGTNQFHGATYEFLRNSALDARNFFDAGQIPHFERNVFGGSLGGPLKKDRAFLFGNYEGFRQVLGLSNVTLVPDNASRSSAAPSVLPLLALWPLANGPNLGGGIAIAYNNPRQSIREDFGTARFDQNFSAKDSFASVYTVDDSEAHTPSANPLSLVDLKVRNQVASLSETHVFSPALVNRGTLGFSRAAYFFTGRTPVNVPGFVQGLPIGAITIGGSTALNSSSQLSAAGTNGNSNLRSDRNLFTLTDQLSVTHGAHLVNTGVWLQQLQSNDNLAANQYGQAVFSTLPGFLQGTVATFTVIPSPTPLSFRQLEGAYYAEDAIKVRPSLELRIGFRGESTNGWNEAHGRASNWLFDANNVIETTPVTGASPYTVNMSRFLPAPRIGIAWSPFSNKTVVRAGFGMYYTLNDSISYRLTQSAPFNTVVVLKNVPVSSINIVPGAAPPSGSKISAAGVQPDLRTPAVVSYSLTVERQLTPSTTLSLGYVGSHGYHQLLSIDANVPVPTICPAAPCPANYPTGTIYFPTGAPLANPSLANTTHWFSWGTSHYDGFQANVVRRLSGGLQFRAAYTFAKALDEGSSLANAISGSTNAFTMNPLQHRLDYGLSSFDIRHSATVNATYELPFGSRTGALSEPLWTRLISKWQISAITTLQTGLPFSPQLGFNPANDGDSRNPVRPSWNPNFAGPVVTGGPNQYFNPNAFIVPLNGTYGNAGRDTLTGPGLSDVDVALDKRIALREGLNLQFRGEIFNVLNRANFNTPNPIVFTSATFNSATGMASATPSPTAGLITATTTTSRQIQFGLKLLW